MIELTFLAIAFLITFIINVIVIRLIVTYKEYKDIIKTNPDFASLLIVLFIFEICLIFAQLLELNKYWRYDYY